MPRLSYRVTGVPTSWGTMAFLPVPSASPEASSNGVNIVSGNPGTMRIPSPPPASMSDTDWNHGLWQPSKVNPDYIMPSIYTLRHIGANENSPWHRTMGGATSDHVLPVPAGSIAAIVGNWMHRARIGGRTVTRAVRPFTQWPTYGGGTQ